MVFYGSCLRKQSAEGVLDLYVVVDDYRSAYGSRALAIANAVLPPNVFYVETRDGETTVRAKYAVISRADLQRLRLQDLEPSLTEAKWRERWASVRESRSGRWRQQRSRSGTTPILSPRSSRRRTRS